MGTHVMVDLETMGVRDDAAIISIGAVKFDPNSDEISDRFYVRVDLESSILFGGKVDGGTVDWWLSDARSDARQALLADQPVDFASSLHGFCEWYGPAPLPLWGNGSDFDNVILRNAIKSVGLHVPWNHYHNRCHRTIKNLAPSIKPDFGVKTAHHALADAEVQAKQLQKIAAHLGIIVS